MNPVLLVMGGGALKPVLQAAILPFTPQNSAALVAPVIRLSS